MPLSESAQEALRTYRYSGQDCSLVYRFLLSPLAAAMVDYFVPRIMAPNTVTFLGLLAPALVYSLGHVLSPSLGCDAVPRSFYLLSAVSLFFYQTMDNMDGKQARRTSSSSALGMMFDHGCDALNTFFSGLNFALTICTGPEPRLVLVVLAIPAVPFFTGTWEEYYTGSMILPIVNGPTEGILIAVASNLVSFAYSPAWWHEPVLAHLPPPTAEVAAIEAWQRRVAAWRRVDLLEVLAYISISLTALKQIYTVVMLRRRRHEAILPALANLGPLFWVSGWGALWILGTGEAASVVTERPRALAALLMTLFAESVIGLMVAHSTKQHYNPCRWIAAPLPLGPLLARFVRDPVTSTSYQALFLLAYLATAVLFLATFIFQTIMDVKTALGIDCFSLRRQQETGGRKAR